MPDKITLYFPAPKRRGLVGRVTYEGLSVRLCDQRNCRFCKLALREQLLGWAGGRLEVKLDGPYKRPSFLGPPPFFIAHLLAVIERERIDIGGEFDTGLNTVCLKTPSGLMVIDPGGVGFNGSLSLKGLIGGERIVASVVSHSHQDHSNLAGQTRGPIYVSQLTPHFVDRRLGFEWDPSLLSARRRMRVIGPGQQLTLDSVQIRTFPLPHSVPDTMGLDIRGRKKRGLCLGDFRLSGWEPETRATTIATLRELAREKVDFLCLTIFNAHMPGFTPMEALVVDTFTTILTSTPKGRVLESCFSSNLDRILEFVQVAQILQRPVAFCGAGMRSTQELLRVKTEEDAIEAENAVVFVTGSQAEEFSVLWRIAQGQNPPFALRLSDTLAFSSRCIPGNEAGFKMLIGSLRPQVKRIVVHEGEIEQIGLRGLDAEEALTHVVGHGNKEDLRLVLEILRPKQVLAWPQTSPQIEAFREIAVPLGIEILPETERIIEI